MLFVTGNALVLGLEVVELFNAIMQYGEDVNRPLEALRALMFIVSTIFMLQKFTGAPQTDVQPPLLAFCFIC